MNKLLVRLLTLMVIVTVASASLYGWFLNSRQETYPWPTNILPNKEIADKYQIVKVGNSHAQDGITLERYHLNSLDLTGAGQELRYDLALLKQHHKQIADQAVVLISVTPISFSQRRSVRTDGLQAIYYGRVSPIYIPYFELGDYLQTQMMPFLRTGFLFREDFTKKLTHRLEQEAGEAWLRIQTDQSTLTTTPLVAETGEESGLAAPMPEQLDYFVVKDIETKLANPSRGNHDLGQSVVFMFDKWMNQSDFAPEHFTDNRHDLEKMIAYCLQNNWRPVLLTIPISEVLEQALPADYKQQFIYDNLSQTNLQGVPFWDFSLDEVPRIDTTLFINSDHLNADGAKLFSYLLLRKLIDTGYLGPEVNGYNYADREG